jgi:hypothetical protein
MGGAAGVISVNSRSTPDIGSLVPNLTTTPSMDAVPARWVGAGANWVIKRKNAIWTALTHFPQP